MKKRFLSAALSAAMLVSFSPAQVITAKAETTINIGDYIQMGTYYGEPILWRCVDVDENGPLMLTDKIICLKSFDLGCGEHVTGSHTRMTGRIIDGSNYWGDSNIRSWLNSDMSAGNVTWLCGNPATDVTDDRIKNVNDYDKEAGFKTNFSDEELGAVKPVTQTTYLYQDEYTNTTGMEQYGNNARIFDYSFENNMFDKDKMGSVYQTKFKDDFFLLGIDQFLEMYKHRDVLGEDYHIGRTTNAAVDNSEKYHEENDFWYYEDLVPGGKWHYWLREPYNEWVYDDRTGSTTTVVLAGMGPDCAMKREWTVGSVDGLGGAHAECGFMGIRPAFYLDTAVSFASGNGTASAPYKFSRTGGDGIGKVPEPVMIPETNINIGDYFEMGTYYGEPVMWRCVDIDEKGPLMLSDRIICIKPYDAHGYKESGSHTRPEGVRNSRANAGSNYWGDSNMRSWLNSNAAAGEVEWLCGNPPTAFYVQKNAYADEAGFKTNFTEVELSAVQTVNQPFVINYNEYEDMTPYGDEAYTAATTAWLAEQNTFTTAYREYCDDDFFLLDGYQLSRVCKNRGILGDEYFAAKPTKEAIENSAPLTGEFATDKYWPYWLRLAYCYDNGGAYNCVLQSDGTIFVNGCETSYCGVRPAFYLKSDTEFKRGHGTENSPYGLQPYIDLTIEGDTVTNNSDYAGRAAVITAYYDGGALTNVTKETVILEATGSEGASYIVTATGEGERKIFVWNSLKGMKPLNISE